MRLLFLLPLLLELGLPSLQHERRHRKNRELRPSEQWGRKGRRTTTPSSDDPSLFQFTAPSYNMSIEENAIGGTLARPVVDGRRLGGERIGVHLPRGYHQISFHIVEGDKAQRFQATAKKLGHFAFLVLEFRPVDAILNRELQSEYQLLIRATAKRKKATSLECSATIHLRIEDQNDNSPMFAKTDYAAKVDTRTPKNSRLLRLEGFDADEGLNGALYYSPLYVDDPSSSYASITSPWHYFYVEPTSGWIRTLYPFLPAGNYSMEFLIEDRASRLFFHHHQQKSGEGDSSDESSSSHSSSLNRQLSFFIRNKATVRLQVEPFAPDDLGVEVEARALPPYLPQSTVVVADVQLRVGGEHTEEILKGLDIQVEVEVEEVDMQIERTSPRAFRLKMASTSTNNTLLPPKLALHLLIKERDMSEGTYRHQPAVLLRQRVELELRFQERALQFIGEVERLYINESAPSGYVVGSFQATTTFKEDQPLIRYKLLPHPTPSLPFELDEITGLLHLKSTAILSHSQTFNLTIGASLHHAPSSASTATATSTSTIIVEVIRSGTHCPLFDNPPKDFRIVLKEKRPANGTIIYKPIIKGGSHSITFKLMGEGGSENFFGVDHQRGEMRISSPLPTTNQKEWTVHLLAVQEGWPLPYYTQLSLTISTTASNSSTNNNITGGVKSSCQLENKHAPSFDGLPLPPHFEVDELAVVGELVGTLQARDADIGYNGLVQYTLGSGAAVSSYFSIHPHTGVISVRRELTSLVQKEKRSGASVDVKVEAIASDMALERGKRKSSR